MTKLKLRCQQMGFFPSPRPITEVWTFSFLFQVIHLSKNTTLSEVNRWESTLKQCSFSATLWIASVSMSLQECHSSHCNFVCPGLSLVWSSLFSPLTYSTWLLSLGVGFKVYFLQLEMIAFGGMATWIFSGTKLSFSIWTLFGLSWHLSFRSKIDPFFNQKHPSVWGRSLPGIIYVVRRSKKDVFARTEWCHGDLVFFFFITSDS